MVTTQKVGKLPASQKERNGVPPAPTKSGTPPNRTNDGAGYTTTHSSFESIPEEEITEAMKKWKEYVRTPNHSIVKGRLKFIRKRTASSTAVQEG